VRVLHVTPYWESAWAYGGIPRVVGLLTHGLAERGHEVVVATTDVCDRDRRLPPETPTDVDLRVFRNVSNRLAHDLQAFMPLGLDDWLRTAVRTFDVGHIHACHNWIGAQAALRLERAGVPYVVAPNGTAPRIERRRLLKRAFDKTIGRRLLPGAARVVAVSEAERQKLLALGVAGERISVIPNPVDSVDPSALDPDRFRAQHGIPADAELIVYLGKLTPRKRVDVLIDAFARLDRTRAHLVIAGNDQGTGAELERQVRRGRLQDRITFTGLIIGHARFDALAAAAVAVYPGSDEVFGLVAVEASLCGAPVVVSDDSGCAEVIAATGGGSAVAAGDPGTLADAMASVLDDPRARARAEGAASRARELFAADAVCARWERLYDQVRRVPAATGALA